MNLEANHARHRRAAYDAQPFFSTTTSLCRVPSAYFFVKGVILTAQATSIMGAVAGLTVALFGSDAEFYHRARRAGRDEHERVGI